MAARTGHSMTSAKSGKREGTERGKTGKAERRRRKKIRERDRGINKRPNRVFLLSKLFKNKAVIRD